jgi:PAS domain S-box-containing protein
MNNNIKKILSIIPELNRDPFFILEGNGRIIFTNKQGKTLLNITNTPEFITDYFEAKTKKKFEDLLDKVFDSYETITNDPIQIKLSNSEIIQAKITLKVWEYDEKMILFCTIIPNEYNIGQNRNSQLGVKKNNKEKIIKNKELLGIINQVEALYPLTFIERETIFNLTNTINEIFWITDTNGKFILVNDYFAKSLKLNPFEVEGKKADIYIPGFFNELNAQVEKFEKQKLNSIVLDGLNFEEFSGLEGKEIIQIPVVDESYNIQAFIGLSQPKENGEKSFTDADLFDNISNLIRFFPKPIAFITIEGTIKKTSREFCKLLETNCDELDGLNFADFLPGRLAENLERFVKSPDNQRNLPLNQQLEIENQEDPEYTVYFTKIFSSENQIKGSTILIEKAEYAENLQHLIRSRGRMFEYLVENNPQPIYVYDKENLKFIEVNKAALDLYGYSKKEFLEMDLTDLYNPEDIQTLISSSSEREAQGIYSKPFRQKRKDGSAVVVEVSKTNFKFKGRDAHFNIIKDITKSQELEKKNQLFKAAFDNTDDMIFVTDPQGIIKYVNSTVTVIIGLPKNELENSSMTSLVVDEDRTILNTSVFQSHLKEPVYLNIGLKSSTGAELNSEISATPVLDFESEVESFVIIGRLKNTSLVQTEGEGNNQEKPSQPARAPLQLESVFLAGIFHEILTPMNVILGFSQELTEGIDTLNPDQKEAVEIINQNRSELLNIMNSIIEFSENQKKKDEWNLSNITITDLAEELNNDIYEITGSKNIEFAFGKISSSLVITTDKQKFDCLLNNLIRLISKLCKDHKIYFSAVPIDENDFIIRISDTYSGTSDYLSDTLSKIFIYNYDPRELGVSKLGTQITKSLLSLLQGKFISSKDQAGKTDYGFRFPIKIDPSLSVGLEELREDGNLETVAEELPEQSQPESIEETDEEQQSETPEEFVTNDQQPAPTEEAIVEDQQLESTEETLVEDSSTQVDHGIEIEEETEIPEESEPITSERYAESINEEKIEDEPDITEPQPAEIVDQQEESSIQSKVEMHSFSLQEDKLDFSNFTCLYIEDQIDSQILFRVQMRGLKDIKYAASFEDSLPLLESEHFDFIVMDINLQGEYNGLDALKIIHKMQKYEDIPIIAVTAYVLPGDKEKFIATGFNDFIAKPIFREKMIESLEKIFLQKA